MLGGVRGSVFSNDCLWKHHLFIDRDPRFVELLSRDVKVEVFKPGEVIVKEGARGNSMYILRRGEVEIIAGGSSVARLGSGSVFGEIMLLGVSDRRTATVKATEFSDCRVVQRKYLQRLLRLFPRERGYFENLASQRFAELRGVNTSSSPRAERQKTLPDLAGGGRDSEANDMMNVTALSEFSRFFEKPKNVWRTGKTKTGTLQLNYSIEPRETPRHLAGDMIALREKPQLPPLITRMAVQRSRIPTEEGEDAETWDCHSESDDASHHPAAKGAGCKGDSFPRPRFFMYEKASPGSKTKRAVAPVQITVSPSVTVSTSAQEADSRLGGGSCSPRLADQLD